LGAVDVTVKNPDGLSDTFVGALFYYPEPTAVEADVETDSTGSMGPQVQGGCSTAPFERIVGLLTFALLFTRRTRGCSMRRARQ
jgi:hypothetical protein